MNIFFRLLSNTFKECVREPIFLLLLLVGLCIVGLLPMFSMFVFREQIKLVVDSSMATTLVFGLVIAALCASHTITREMRNGTVLLLLSKPVPRQVFIFAKIFGVLSSLTLFVVAMLSASFISVLIAEDQFRLNFVVMGLYYGLIALIVVIGGVANYLKNISFASSSVFLLAGLLPLFAVACYLIGGTPDDEAFVPPVQYFSALCLLFPAVWLMGTIASALATRCGIVMNLTVCSILFFLGLISKYLGNHWLDGGFWGTLVSSLLPNWQYFWMADALAAKTPIPIRYLLWTFFYTLLYGSFWFVWAAALFHDREVAADSSN